MHVEIFFVLNFIDIKGLLKCCLLEVGLSLSTADPFTTLVPKPSIPSFRSWRSLLHHSWVWLLLKCLTRLLFLAVFRLLDLWAYQTCLLLLNSFYLIDHVFRFLVEHLLSVQPPVVSLKRHSSNIRITFICNYIHYLIWLLLIHYLPLTFRTRDIWSYWYFGLVV